MFKHLAQVGSTEHTFKEFLSLACKKLKALLLVNWTSLAKFNFVLLWAKLHLFFEILEKGKQRYLMNQKFIK